MGNPQFLQAILYIFSFPGSHNLFLNYNTIITMLIFRQCADIAFTFWQG